MKTICFCGMDGSGKSTQCRMLADRLRDSGVEVEVIHLLSEGGTVSSRIQGKPVFKILHKKLKDLPRHGFLGSIKLAAGLISFFADAWVTTIRHRIKYGRKVVVYDRYFYDHLVLFAASFPETPWWTINLVRILPGSDLVIMMEVPPEIGNVRKPEDSVEKLTRCSKFYRLLSSILGIEIVDGTGDVNRIAECVYRRCAKLIEDKG